MRKLSFKKKVAIGIMSAVSAICLVAGGCSAAISGYEDPSIGSTLTDVTTKNVSGTQYYGSLEALTEGYASEFIMVRHKSLGGSHYAYTEGITDDLAGLNGGEGNEANFFPGSQLVKISLKYEDGELITEEEVLLNSPNGVLRDPDVSADGTKIVFSWKTSKTQDDYHLYVYEIETGYYEQITFGQGISDTEPKWLPNGKIVFSSSRCVQIIDCWKTPISNLYVCNEDGSDMIRVGYDQVHTTYPTVTEDGRVLYTRWDYNDRTQMYVHGIFQMNADGTNQTAVYGNNTNNPTSQMHTVAVPGSSNKYLTIMAGHHVYQGGKLAIIDTSIGREGKDPITYVRESAETSESFDTLGQSGPIYKYPIAINEYEMIYAKAPNGWASAKEETKFNIYYYNTVTGEEVLIADNSNVGAISCSQISPIRTRQMFDRPSMVNYASTTGTYYVADVYEGESMANVARGEVKYLRVVALDYRPYAVGSLSAGNSDVYPDGFGTSDPSTPVGVANSTWDVKQVIGIVPVEEDGSVMFSCPSDTPVYFQLLDANGFMIQTMRSWSTLMPGEVFSCVGCHEDKNTVPISDGKVTLAMKKGVQRLQKDLWMTTSEYDDYDPYTEFAGFSYANEIQPILDQSCVTCHTNVQKANDRLGSSGITADLGTPVTDNTWNYKVTTKSESVDVTSSSLGSGWSSAAQPFGSDAGSSVQWGASSDAVFYMTQKFTLTSDQLGGKFFIKWQYDEDPVLYINGVEIANENTGGHYITGTTYFELSAAQKANLKAGENVITARAWNALGGSYMYVELSCLIGGNTSTSEPPIALTSEVRSASRDKVDYYLSYLVLTGAFLRGNYYVGRPTNDITDWVGGMSNPETIPAYAHGSTQSNLFEILKAHEQYEGYTPLSDDEIARLATWIDLGVPFRGSYNEASENWGSTEMAEAERRQNMRDYYDTIDKLNKAKLAGQLTNKKVLIDYYDKNGDLVGSYEGKHLAILYLDQKMQPGDMIVVTLPKGENYVWFNLNPKMKLSLQYCPDGTFTYIIPTYAEMVLPNLTVGNDQYVYTHPTITAYLATTDEIYNTTYNVALNPYDLPYDYASGGYTNYDESLGTPRITTGSAWEGNSLGNFYPNNAFDGICNNRGEGAGNMDGSWGPSLYEDNKHTGGAYEDPAKLWIMIDFGREVELEYFVIYVRAYGFGSHEHDTWIKSLEIEYGDGQTITWDDLIKTNQAQTLQLEESIRTTYLKITVKEKADPEKWFGITEFEAYGKNVR